MLGTALYHPAIDIEDPVFLRSAILFWDHLHTIVPDPIDEPYKDKDVIVWNGLASQRHVTPTPFPISMMRKMRSGCPHSLTQTDR